MIKSIVYFFVSCIVVPCLSQFLKAFSPLDPSSYSRPEQAINRHVSLHLDVDFEKQVLRGTATLSFHILENINELPLDVSKLNIESIKTETGTELNYVLSEHIANFGSKLTIIFPNELYAGEKIKIKIKYATDPSASGLTWLNPLQTTGKKYPYLFSQCSPIHARSIIPCQDTSAVKFTYDATVTAPEEFTVLMGALKGEVVDNKSTFHQPVPVPANLLAIAVGALESRVLGSRSKVWSEKEDVDSCASEFADTEKYIQAAEKVCGPYDWTVYDLLVLPPSFPHGAMENPCMTFVSPTVVVGDKSLADVILHEIMHSWAGNLVSIKNFEHFWLNEGFTVYLERKISVSLKNNVTEGKQIRDFHSLLGLQQLREGVETLGATNPLTKLVVDLDGVHPDEAFSIIPYEKGSLFLRYLEDLLGGPGTEIFDEYILSYVTTFRRQAINTDQFKAHFIDFFKNNTKLEDVDWDAWLNKPGMPPVIPNYDTTMTEAVTHIVLLMKDDNFTFKSEDVKDFNVHQLIHMLQQLIEQPPMPLDKLNTLGNEYNIKESHNDEILYRWLRLNVRSRNEGILNEVFSFLNRLGRLKYVRPLYRELYAWESVREQAIENFLQNEQYMSHLTAFNIRQDLHLSN